MRINYARPRVASRRLTLLLPLRRRRRVRKRRKRRPGPVHKRRTRSRVCCIRHRPRHRALPPSSPRALGRRSRKEPRRRVRRDRCVERRPWRRRRQSLLMERRLRRGHAVLPQPRSRLAQPWGSLLRQPLPRRLGLRLLLLQLQTRARPTRARRRAHPERILAIRKPDPPALDQPPQRVAIQLVQRPRRVPHIVKLRKRMSVDKMEQKKISANPPPQNTSAHSPSA
ncbi:hypothetical protein K438DRAFT_996458 [Mycena galopus ATCC 62051]|nr:hypothetical protein K438DRAFT_996458 [Mycena galopus ATCC 62051]